MRFVPPWIAEPIGDDRCIPIEALDVKIRNLMRSIPKSRSRRSSAGIVAGLAATCLLAVPTPAAKDFGPGDLRVCGRAAPRLDRFRAYGFFCGRFRRGKWYRFPARAAAALRMLTAGLRPLRVSAPPPSC